MTKFADELLDDLMREHGQTLAGTRVPAAGRRHPARRPVLLTAGAGGLAAAITVGTLVGGGGTPAYAVTAHHDGTVTLAVYQKSGIAQANAQLRRLGDSRVVLVPVEPGCPSISSLPGPGKAAAKVKTSLSMSTEGPVTVDAQGIPAGDILVVGFQAATKGMGLAGSKLTSAPPPKCISLPALPAGGGTGAGGGTVTGGGPGSGNGTATGGGPGPVTSTDGPGTSTRGTGPGPITSHKG
jgi:hypothetical protein